MAQEITTPIILQHSNVIIGSEIVTVKETSSPALIRNVDYIMDYEQGMLRFIDDGMAIELASLIEEHGVDINYSYQLDFAAPSLFESQIEVFGEVASRVTDFKVSTKFSPITEVIRVFNATTLEEYSPTSIHQNTILFTGENPPTVTPLKNISSTLLSAEYDFNKDRVINKYQITYPKKYSAETNPITQISAIKSLSVNSYLAVIGGEETLNVTFSILAPYETQNIQLVTGGKTLKSSRVILLSGADYGFTTSNVLEYSDFKSVNITLTPLAIQKIRTNNLYINLSFTESASEINSNIISINSQPINQKLSFTTNVLDLTFLPRQVKSSDVGDDLISPPVIVTSASQDIVYVEGQDYSINFTQRKITKLLGSTIQSNAVIYYLDSRALTFDFSLVSDVVIVDYIWSNNSLNWTSQQKIVPITEVKTINKNTRSILLKYIPADYSKVNIYIKDDFTKSQVVEVVSFNEATKKLLVEPFPITSEYVFEYDYKSQPIEQGSPYYVAYKYGATREVLKNRHSKLVGIEDTTTLKEEVISLSAGSTKTILTRAPLNLDTLQIFLENDLLESQVATAIRFDSLTYQLFFTSIFSSGKYIFRYETSGFDTRNLRIATTKLYENFKEGPTLQGFLNIIEGFVSTPPEVSSGLDTRFTIASNSHLQGNEISLVNFATSTPLDDGTPSISYLPSRFNLGILFDSSKQGFIKAPSVSNIGFPEGTLEFLAGIIFNANDNQEHYFVDIKSANPRANRFSLYKSKNNKLNFDIWDNKGQLFRSSLDVAQTYYTEIIELKAGASTAILKNSATPATIDQNSNLTPDLYEALETKFIIMPETPTFPPTYLKASIKVLGYDPTTRTVSFEPVSFSGKYIFSYVGGLVKFEETENFLAISWKMHTHDGQPPFYRLYVNGRKVINVTLQDIDLSISPTKVSTYDNSKYDIDVYKE